MRLLFAYCEQYGLGLHAVCSPVEGMECWQARISNAYGRGSSLEEAFLRLAKKLELEPATV